MSQVEQYIISIPDFPESGIVLIDDLIATGGTLKAAIELLNRLGAVVVKVVCLIELKNLKGREFLKDYKVDTVISYKEK